MSKSFKNNRVNFLIKSVFIFFILTNCSQFVNYKIENECICYNVNRDSKSFHYEGEKFNLKLICMSVYKEGKNFKTNSRWEVRAKDGMLLCKSPSKVYKNSLMDHPGSGFFDKVWIHEDEYRALIFIDELGPWYNYSSNTIVFEKNNKGWRSKIIGIPGPAIVAEGNGGTIHSVDIYGNITYEDPYAWNQRHKKYKTAHYSRFEVIEQFPPGRFW
jgi:hypothetical protein